MLGNWAALLAAAAVPLLAAPFVVPTDGPVAFRRDRLPLDVDTMRVLAGELGVLAHGQGGENPVSRRTVAQMLALALALQPANPDARRSLEQFEKTEPKASGEPTQLEAIRARGWQMLAWLETPEAGADGHALAACLGDVLAIADPKHPRAAEWRAMGEQGAWSGWVQPLAAFSRTGTLVKINPPGNSTQPGPKIAEAPKNAILLEKAVVTTPLWTYSGATKEYVMRPVPIRMQAKLKEGYARAEPLSCFLEISRSAEGYQANSFKTTSDALVKALEKQHGKLPAGIAVSLGCGDRADYLGERNHSAISGAAAVLMNAAISGCEPSATIIGEVDANGIFKLPPQFWDKLRALADGPGGRLVLPVEAESYLPSILALEEPGFFFKYEVLLAANLRELVERSAKVAAPELAQLSARFLEVRSKLGSQDAAAYAANRFVRQRLEDLFRSASFHASACMLAIQGAGKRPARLSRNILACELHRAIMPMAWIPSQLPESLPIKRLNDTFETCLKDVDRLARYVEMRDRDLHAQVRGTVLSIRTLARATRGQAVDPNKPSVVPWREEFEVLVRSFQTVTSLLTRTAAEE